MAQMRTPDASHPLSSTHTPRRVQALYEGHLIADSIHAVVLSEGDEPDAYYFPREDVEMEVMAKTDHVTDCAYKGRASYWSILRDGHWAENAAWSYENPHPAAEELRGLIAFDPEEVDIHIVKGENLSKEAERMGEYIRHTDSGSGRSQEAPWEANVGRPDPEAGEDEDREGSVYP